MTADGSTISIMIVEDHDVTRLGLKLGLCAQGMFKVVAEVGDGQTAVDLALKLHPNVILMDVGLPVMGGIEATRRIKANDPSIKVIMFTTHESDQAVFDALSAGADGYCLKNAPVDQIALAVRTVSTGAAWLDPGIAGKVLRSRLMAKSLPPSSQNPVDKTPSFSERERRILSLVEQGGHYDTIGRDLGLPAADIKQTLSQILQKMVTHPEGDSPTPVDSQVSDGTEPSDRMLDQFQAGEVIGKKYKIELILGSGGMSTVFKATHSIIGKSVAIKVLHKHLCRDLLLVQRFQVEARAASTLTHPNIINVYDLGVTDDDRPFLVMDYVEGSNLQTWLEEGKPLDIKKGVGIFQQVCEGLAAAHAKNIIHRDLKPSNIMIIKTPSNTETVKIIDFGIAKIMDDDTKSGNQLTRAGEVMGSVSYMSPEQCMGMSLDLRSDIYSLGCTMYEAFSGVQVFAGSSALEVLSKHIHHMPARFSRACPDRELPQKLESIIFKALMKEPERRFQSAMELHASLDDLLAAQNPG